MLIIQFSFSIIDIDECKDGSARCDADSMCQNQPGTYLCVKRPVEIKEKPCAQQGYIRNAEGVCVGKNIDAITAFLLTSEIVTKRRMVLPTALLRYCELHDLNNMTTRMVGSRIPFDLLQQ